MLMWMIRTEYQKWSKEYFLRVETASRMLSLLEGFGDRCIVPLLFYL